MPLPASPQAAAAADAASADLKTLEQQITANPPSGSASPATAGSRGNGAVADAIGPSDYLGQTYDLEGDQGAAPALKPRSPEFAPLARPQTVAAPAAQLAVIVGGLRR